MSWVRISWKLATHNTRGYSQLMEFAKRGWHRDDSRLRPSQWETSLQSNTVSRWLGANLESALWHIWDQWCGMAHSICLNGWTDTTTTRQYTAYPIKYAHRFVGLFCFIMFLSCHPSLWDTCNISTGIHHEKPLVPMKTYPVLEDLSFVGQNPTLVTYLTYLTFLRRVKGKTS